MSHKQGEAFARRDEDVLAVLRRQLREIIEPDVYGERAVRRLARASTSVEFHINGADDAGVTLLLDRFPPRVTDEAEPAEVRIDLTVEQAELLAAGRLNVPSAVFMGQVSFDGPVRSFLAVDPVLRHLLARAWPS